MLNLLLISYTIYFKVSCLPKCRQCVLSDNINFMSLLINVSNVSWTYTHRFERWLLLGLLIPQKAINYKTNISAFFLLSYTFFVVVVIFHYLSPGNYKKITKFVSFFVIFFLCFISKFDLHRVSFSRLYENVCAVLLHTFWCISCKSIKSYIYTPITMAYFK